MSTNNGASGPPISGAMPSGKPAQFIPIARPSPGCKVYGVVLNDTIYGVWVHFQDGRTQPCLGLPLDCPACQANLPRRWYGYLPILLVGAGRLALAELTAACVADCPNLHVALASLRGKLLTLVRIGQSKRSRVRVTFEAAGGRTPLPDPVDVVATLARLWGTQAAVGKEDLGVEEGGQQ